MTMDNPVKKVRVVDLYRLHLDNTGEDKQELIGTVQIFYAENDRIVSSLIINRDLLQSLITQGQKVLNS